MRPIHEIAREIAAIWGPRMYFGAVPYVSAMRTLSTTSDKYGLDSGDSIVRYALANMATFRGADARRLKAELKEHLK